MTSDRIPLFDYHLGLGWLHRHPAGRQVLAGAGPAVAAVPLVVVWAGGSAVNLVQGIARRQVGPRGTVSRIGFVSGQTVAQVPPSLPPPPPPFSFPPLQAPGPYALIRSKPIIAAAYVSSGGANPNLHGQFLAPRGTDNMTTG